MQETFDRVEEFLRGEEAVQLGEGRPTVPERPARGLAGCSNNEGRKPWQIRQETGGRVEVRYIGFAPYDRPNSSREREKFKYTPLTKTPKELLSTEDVGFRLKPPRPMTGSLAHKNMGKYCEFHCDRAMIPMIVTNYVEK
jgi:hypothetical protein